MRYKGQEGAKKSKKLKKKPFDPGVSQFELKKKSSSIHRLRESSLLAMSSPAQIPQLSRGCLTPVFKDGLAISSNFECQCIVQVVSHPQENAKGMVKLTLSDGLGQHSAVLASQLKEQYTGEEIWA